MRRSRVRASVPLNQDGEEALSGYTTALAVRERNRRMVAPEEASSGGSEPVTPDLTDLLTLERLDCDSFRYVDDFPTRLPRLFGGQVVAQALRAATLTVDALYYPHSLHGYFLRPGRPQVPVLFQVERTRQGRSFTTRRVVATQDGATIFTLSASFHRDEQGDEFQVPMAQAAEPPPEVATAVAGASGPEDGPRWMLMVREIAPDAPEQGEVYRSTRRIWMRTRGRLPDDRALHACALAYMADLGAVTAAVRATRQEKPGGNNASLDHAVWFHRPVRADEWLLYDLRPLSSSAARGFVMGSLHTADGTLGASMTQETLIRLGPSDEPKVGDGIPPLQQPR